MIKQAIVTVVIPAKAGIQKPAVSFPGQTVIPSRRGNPVKPLPSSPRLPRHRRGSSNPVFPGSRLPANGGTGRGRDDARRHFPPMGASQNFLLPSQTGEDGVRSLTSCSLLLNFPAVVLTFWPNGGKIFLCCRQQTITRSSTARTLTSAYAARVGILILPAFGYTCGTSIASPKRSCSSVTSPVTNRNTPTFSRPAMSLSSKPTLDRQIGGKTVVKGNVDAELVLAHHD